MGRTELGERFRRKGAVRGGAGDAENPRGLVSRS